MCTDRILMDSEKKETGRPSFIYKENANELEPAIINLQTTNKYTWKKKRGTDLDF